MRGMLPGWWALGHNTVGHGGRGYIDKARQGIEGDPPIFRVLSSCRFLQTAWLARSYPALLGRGTRCTTPLQFPVITETGESESLRLNTEIFFLGLESDLLLDFHYLFKSIACNSLEGLLHIDCLLSAGFKIWDVVLALAPSLCSFGCYLTNKRPDVNNKNKASNTF